MQPRLNAGLFYLVRINHGLNRFGLSVSGFARRPLLDFFIKLLDPYKIGPTESDPCAPISISLQFTAPKSQTSKRLNLISFLKSQMNETVTTANLGL